MRALLKTAAVVSACFFLAAACSGPDRDRIEKRNQQNAQEEMDRARVVCRDGVQWFHFSNNHGGSFAVRTKQDGKPYLCGEKSTEKERF